MLLCAPAGPAVADELLPVDLPRGTRLRVTAPTVAGDPLVGTLAAQDERVLTLDVNGRPRSVTVPREAITRLERSGGHGRSRGKGALVGAGIGLGAGVLVGLLHGGDNPNQLFAFSAGEYALSLGLAGVAAGSLIGLAVPSSERWENVPPSGLHVVVGPTRGRGMAIAVSLVR